jgi:hypothetical protein
MAMSTRRMLPLAITFVFGFFMVLDFFFSTPLSALASDVNTSFVVVANFAVITAVGSVTLMHIRKIRKREDWYNSLALLVVLYLVIAIGWSSPSDPTYMWWFNNMFVPLETTVFCLLAFYISSASYRVFKARSKEAALLLLSAVLVMWGRAPISAVISDGFGTFADWMMAVPNTAGMRGIVIGVGIGVISIGIRTLLGIERGHLGGRAE